MASVSPNTLQTRPVPSPVKDTTAICNGTLEPMQPTTETLPGLPKLQPPSTPAAEFSASDEAQHHGSDSLANEVLDAISNSSSGSSKTVKMTDLDSNQVEIRSDRETCPASGMEANPTSPQDGCCADRDGGGDGGDGGGGVAAPFQEPVSLSTTSSLLRQVHQLGEEAEDRDLCLSHKFPPAQPQQPGVVSLRLDAGGSEAAGGGGAEGSENPGDVTYHVLERSAVVKFEPEGGLHADHGAPGLNGVVADQAPGPMAGEGGGAEGGVGESQGFDGHTITLVEDENNAGTFKIAEIGDDNTLRVIDNDRIVVFENETAVTAVCKQEQSGLDAGPQGGGDESGPSCITRSINALNGDLVDLPPGAYDGKEGEGGDVYKAGGRRGGLRKVEAAECGRGGSSQPYLDEQGVNRQMAGVHTFADTSIMRPLHAESGQPVGSHPHPHHPQHLSARTDAHLAFAALNGAAGQENVAGNHSGPQVKTWHHPVEQGTQQPYPREPSAPYHQQPQPHMAGSSSGHVPAASHPHAQHQPQHQHQQQQPQSYPEYGHSSASSSATSHGSYGDAGTSYPAPLPQMAAWTSAPGHVVAGHSDDVMAYPADGEQKMVGGEFGHPHPYPLAPSYLPPGSGGYAGYPGNVNRSWRPVKAGKAGDVHPGTGCDVSLYQPPPPHPHHPGYPAHGHMARGYPVYPGWEAPPHGHHVHYMASGSTSSARGRGGSRINKNRVHGVAQNSAPVNISSMRSRSSAPVPLNTATVGRPRKRSASQAAGSMASKAGFQGSSAGAYTAGKEPARKRSRDGQQPVSISALGTLASNVHTLKPGHIIAWYIDYLIHENEDRTQISRAFTLPVNLFHTDDFYFLDSLRKTIRFPSPKFLAWMQCHLPSLNAHAIDFREGRPPRDASLASSGGAWGPDWAWQNKSKRDIIHDVFFYFQHRKAASAEPPHQYVSVGTSRAKAQMVA